MKASGNIPTGERLLSLLADLYADQMGVKIKYIITDKEESKDGNLRSIGAVTAPDPCGGLV